MRYPVKNSGRLSVSRAASTLVAERPATPESQRIPTCLLPTVREPETDLLKLPLASLEIGTETEIEPKAETETTAFTFAQRDALYAEFQPLARRLIRQYGDTNEAREDLMGEIYYRFCHLLDCFDPTRGIPLKPYLVRQLSASIYTYARHQWRRQKREIAMELESGLSEQRQTEDPSRQWDDKLTLDHARQGLPDALRQLSLRQRQVVIWRYYEARSFEEIAERLSIQPATARSILRHGLTNIRHKLIRANHCYE